MNSMSLDPKITLSVYIICAVLFVAAMIGMFLYTRGLKTRRATEQTKGRSPVIKKEGIAIETENKNTKSL